MLDTLFPQSHVAAFVGPAHHTVPMSLILLIVALITVTGLPLEDAVPVLLVCFVHPLVRVALSLAILVGLLFLPFSVAMLQTILKLSSVTAAIFPFILTEAFGLSLCVLSHIAVSVGEEVRAVALAQALEPLALILVTVGEHMHTVALGLGLNPLANIGFSIGALPDTVSVLDTLHPLTVVDFPVFPLVDALAVCFTVLVCAMIRVAIGEDLVSTSMSLVLEPLALIDAPILIHKHT